MPRRAACECLPGEGSFDLPGFIKLLDEIGVQAPISVEIPAPEHQRLTVREAAQPRARRFTQSSRSRTREERLIALRR